MYDIFIECERNELLRGVFPAQCSGCGFAWPATEESAKMWYDTVIAHPLRLRPQPSFHESKEQYMANCCRQIRCKLSSLFFPRYDWKESVPLRDDFETPQKFGQCGGQYRRGKEKIKSIHFNAKCNPTLRMVVELMKIIRGLGHTILTTRGFKEMEDGTIKITHKEHKLVNVQQVRELQLCLNRLF
jgi:hypothetical protein